LQTLNYEKFSSRYEKGLSAQLGVGNASANGMIELTKLCSLKCVHCYLGDARWNKDPDELTTQQVKDILDALALRGTLWLTITGGEPMSRKDFKEIWLHAKQNGFILNLFTNALSITSEMADFLEQYPPYNLEVSIYGATAEVYEKVSLVKGSFNRFLSGINNIQSKKLNWELKTVLIQQNSHQLEAMRAMAQDWGVAFKFEGTIFPSVGKGKSGGMAPCATRVDSPTWAQKHSSDEQIKKDVSRIRSEIASPKPDEFLYSCGAGKNLFYITAQGHLQMCLLTAHRGHSLLKGHSISEQMDSIWGKFSEYRKIKHETSSPCPSCDLLPYCDNCPGKAQLETGKEQSAVEWICRNTHLKAKAMKLPHRCDSRHFL